MHKIYRIGHHNFKHGVITIASSVEKTTDGNHLISYGVSYCSPKEKKYDRRLGNQMAFDRINTNNIQYFGEIAHNELVDAIVDDILISDAYPNWAFDLLWTEFTKPQLKRFSNTHNVFNPEFPRIEQISVNSDEAKEQLIEALLYLRNFNVDMSYTAVFDLLNIYFDSDTIVVQ